MVILKFNKLIRNKWVWGVFALLVSAAFIAPDGCMGSSAPDRSSSLNKLPGVKYDVDLHRQCDSLVRGFFEMVDSPLNMAKLFDKRSVESTWKAYAAIVSFREQGIKISDEALADRIKSMRVFANPATQVFDPMQYQRVLANNLRMTPADFESYLRLMMTLETGLIAVEGLKAGTPHNELEQTCFDFTDKFTVRVATFEEDKAKAKAIKLDDAALKKWYDDNKGTFALADRYKLRYVKLNPVASNLLVKVSVTDDQIKARYAENCQKGLYDVLPATTNDVKKIKPIEEVRSSIEIVLKNEAAKKMLLDKINSKMPAEGDEAKAKAFLDNLAKEEGVKVQVSDWVTFGGRDLVGFTKSVAFQFPGVSSSELQRKVKSLPYTNLDIVSTDKDVWVFELAETSQAHTPEFDKVKRLVEPKALADAKADLFKNTVEAIAKKGADEVLKTANVSTNIVFQPCAFSQVAFGGGWDFKKAGFENADKIVFPAMKLAKGGVSDFIKIGPSKAVLVVCCDRTPGNADDYKMGMDFAREADLMRKRMFIGAGAEKWLDWNYKRLSGKSSAEK